MVIKINAPKGKMQQSIKQKSNNEKRQIKIRRDKITEYKTPTETKI